MTHSVDTHQAHPSGARIGRYLVDGKLGEGGMAETWLCRLQGAKGFTRRVVVKTLKPEVRTPEYETMFADEARIGARLDHPCIARVHDFGEANGVAYLVQEYVEGPSVYQLLHRQRIRRHFDIRLGCRIIADIALALDHAFNAVDEDGRPLRVVHRDVSPSNILVSRKGVPKLIDFGVAMFSDRETRTQTGVLKGKYLYMAPEVLLREDVSHQSDLYSLGVILYALCVGEPAWTGADEVSERLKGRVERPSARRRDLPRDLDDIILTCLHVDPAHRYPTGRALAADLHGWLEANGGPVSDAYLADEIAALFPDGAVDWLSGSFDPTAVSRLSTWKPRSRPRWMLAALTLGGLGVLMALVVTLAMAVAWFAVRGIPRPPPPVAEAAPSESAAPDVNAAAVVLLDNAAEALDRNQVAEAASHLRAVAGIELFDPALLSRREQLQARMQVSSRVRTARELMDLDAEMALMQALELESLFPGEKQVANLITDARTVLAARSSPASTAPRSKRSTPEARPAGSADDQVFAALAIDGSPHGASVKVDGRPAGTLPLQLAVTPGRHQIHVAMDGFTSRDLTVDSRAGAVHQVEISLPPGPLADRPRSDPPAPEAGLLDPFAGGATEAPGPGASTLQDPFGSEEGAP